MQDQTQSFRSAREWLSVLARYREPSTRRSLFELAATLVPFLALWALAWMALQVSPWLALALAVLNGAFLVRIFIIQHDCGHGSFLANRKAQDWVGRVLGVLRIGLFSPEWHYRPRIVGQFWYTNFDNAVAEGGCGILKPAPPSSK